MNSVTGKILLQETGLGIPNLVVTVYDVDRDTLPEDVLKAGGQGRVPMVTDVWEQLRGDRLGSVLTDDSGNFSLEYEADEPDQKTGAGRPDLMLFVTAPERSDIASGAPILHVSHGIRQNAGHVESYVITLPTEQLHRTGVAPLPGAPPLSPLHIASNELLAQMKRRAAERRSTTEGDGASSKIHRQVTSEAVAMQNASAADNLPPPQRAVVPIPVRVSSDDHALAAAEIVFDPLSGGFTFRAVPEADPVPVSFVGARYLHDVRDAIEGLSLVVDPHARTFHISAPSSPVHLELPGTGPSGLFSLFTAQRLQAD